MKIVDESRQIVALSLAAHVGAVTFKKLIEEFGDVASIFKAASGDLEKIKRLPRTLHAELKSGHLFEKADKEIAKAVKNNTKIVSILDPCYPEDLKAIYDAPMVLYVKGVLPARGAPVIAIVGSRKASLYGLRMAKNIASGLSKAGVIVVSGMALGIDSAAHEGALFEDGMTLAVLGGGLSKIYPPQNKGMAERIAKKGAVLSEYPMEMSPKPEYFPMRNRIISGLSRAVLVVEAGEKSGALITADTALEQGRDVFAVPGNADSERSNGTNALIKQGAKLVTSVSDILEELRMTDNVQLQDPKKFLEARKALNLNPEEEKLFALLDSEPLPIDILIEQSGMTPSRTITSLSGLQMKGAVKELPGKNFVRNP